MVESYNVKKAKEDVQSVVDIQTAFTNGTFKETPAEVLMKLTKITNDIFVRRNEGIVDSIVNCVADHRLNTMQYLFLSDLLKVTSEEDVEDLNICKYKDLLDGANGEFKKPLKRTSSFKIDTEMTNIINNIGITDYVTVLSIYTNLILFLVDNK